MSCNSLGFLALFSLVLICMLNAASVIFWAYHSSDAFGEDKRLYRIVLIYFSAITINVILWGIANCFFCFTLEMYSFFEDLGAIFVGLQYVFLILILYLRLIFIFKGTTFELSSRTKNIFYITYILFISVIIIMNLITFTPLFHTIFTTLLMGTLLILFLSLIVMLIGLFIYKLVMVLKNVNGADGKNHKMIGVITKTFILTMASIISVFFLITAVLLQSNFPGRVHVTLISGILAQTDIQTNALSISLGFNKFEHYYMKICGLCQNKCIDLCGKMVTGTSGKILVSSDPVTSRSGNELTVTGPDSIEPTTSKSNAESTETSI